MGDPQQVRRDAERLRGNVEAGLRLLAKPRSGLSARTAEVCIEDLNALAAMSASVPALVEAALQVLDSTTSDEVHKEARRALVESLTVYEQSQGNTDG